ncbi:sigma-70 family RNA polymerase sigma factor [Paenibacillus arenilitoris]|uniref:Sigma-70 family RNA polymerase sigma factor n=1 Tax=Paenibacillus arenilitoris TaxID=2772299 RepID=A0A927CHR4_9BACL|nr:sigma-70 family RNA polymerase sigma factor [Paenibacillus arenilitoris]MBD2868319.1 sigma-70 family RNA polymerase sigma factor [Paenibacillus arenilitoris]
MEIQQAYDTYKPLLQSIAYRMLGSFSEAEDAVQDVYADYFRLQSGPIENEKAYLIRMLTNRCLNVLQSARKRREVYPGTWLPEPDVRQAGETMDPAELYDRDESVSYGLLVMLEQLTATERAVFILRESLQYEYSEIAECLRKSEANCRKIFSRAKSKLNPLAAAPAPSGSTEPLVATFIAAARSGDFGALVELLAEEAVLLADGGGKVRTAVFPIYGKERILALLKGTLAKGFFGDGEQLVDVNGQPGFILYSHGRPSSILCFQWDERQRKAERIFVVSNPDKLETVLKGIKN